MPAWPVAPAPVDLGNLLQRRLRLGQGEVEGDLQPLEEAGDEAALLGEERVKEMLDATAWLPSRVASSCARGQRARRPFRELVQIHGANLA